MRLKEAERIPRAVVGGLVALVLIVVIAAAIYWVYRVEIQLYFKEQYGKPMSDSKLGHRNQQRNWAKMICAQNFQIFTHCYIELIWET